MLRGKEGDAEKHRGHGRETDDAGREEGPTLSLSDLPGMACRNAAIEAAADEAEIEPEQAAILMLLDRIEALEKDVAALRRHLDSAIIPH